MQAVCRAPRALLAAAATAAIAVPGIALAQDGTGGSSAEDRTSTSTTRPPESPAQRSARRALVVAAQRELGVKADGVVGARTRAAIRRFQRRNDIPATGRLDRRTLRALGVGTSVARTRTAADDSAGAPSETAAQAVAAAEGYIGASYASGATGPDSFDCSGLTVTSFADAGLKLPRTSFDQFREGKRVAKAAIQAGDLVFFDSNGPGASHVGIATSPTRVISTTTSGVKRHTITSGYWAEHYVGARRVA